MNIKKYEIARRLIEYFRREDEKKREGWKNIGGRK